jgi:hypothetical protein
MGEFYGHGPPRSGTFESRAVVGNSPIAGPDLLPTRIADIAHVYIYIYIWQFLFCSVVHFPPAPGWHTKSACPPSPPNFNVGVCDAGKTMWLLIRSLTWSTLKLGVRGPLGDFLAFVLRRTGARGVTASTAYRIN